MISQKESTKPSTALQDLYSSKAKNSLLSIWNLSAICCEKWQTCMQLDELQYNSSQWYWCMLENQEVKTVSNTDSPFVAEMVGWSRKFATLRGYLAGPANPKEIKESKQKDPPNADCCFFNVCTSSNSMSWLLAPSCLAIDLFQWCCAKSCERRPVGAGEVSTQSPRRDERSAIFWEYARPFISQIPSPCCTFYSKMCLETWGSSARYKSLLWRDFRYPLPSTT